MKSRIYMAPVKTGDRSYLIYSPARNTCIVVWKLTRDDKCALSHFIYQVVRADGQSRGVCKPDGLAGRWSASINKILIMITLISFRPITLSYYCSDTPEITCTVKFIGELCGDAVRDSIKEIKDKIAREVFGCEGVLRSRKSSGLSPHKFAKLFIELSIGCLCMFDRPSVCPYIYYVYL